LTTLIVDKANTERSRIEHAISADDVLTRTFETIRDLESSLSDGTARWKALFPGRVILKTFCSNKHSKFDFGRFKLGYLKTSEKRHPSPFSEIIDIFESFSTYKTTSQ